ncbi:GNAT family N-acetyltransferase [Dasania sp. GY-MA-18]|uniref:GNAT family N-acetyltransferase n=1 Tax=Dasania phycosphaerae TaxID=2950436 RepID=A0A9J6RJE9_9GAMM|nr:MULTISPECIES: GNAT family N-acetyltransferase [Dasania]MCR8922061.1 GNAT family N-acetyltransferase [Dasania sp. GY-MA-18]MCZ0864489.1 GNAT family N-acetyltransferase [Dasania phycosphaerae]MCZ0868217.1 GNAT family N-acetyltransferase [Dasania phycosphaerae]
MASTYQHLKISSALAADAERISAVVASAFSHDPIWRWLFPQDSARNMILKQIVSGALRYPWVYKTENFESVAVWIPPYGSEMLPEHEQQLPETIKTLTGERAEQVSEFIELFEKIHPQTEPHYYLSLLATHDDYRGRGLGMALLEENLARLDEMHMPAYLESSNPANDKRYQAVGFEPIGRYQAPNNGPTFTAMWRDKR